MLMKVPNKDPLRKIIPTYSEGGDIRNHFETGCVNLNQVPLKQPMIFLLPPRGNGGGGNGGSNALWAVPDTSQINLVVYMMVIMLLRVEVVVALWMNYTELAQRAFHPQTLKEDVEVTDIHNNMINLNRV